MNATIHRAEERGHANHGWLNSHHSFSFANYYNPEKMNFGALRVLNDDRIAPGTGFGKHPHENMEIISIPLEGDLKHEDSMGNKGVIRHGEVQVMSAGTGIVHSEMNASKTEDCAFLQIWIIPNQQGVEPRYGQGKIDTISSEGEWNEIVGPKSDHNKQWIHQDARMYLTQFEKNTSSDYRIKGKSHGVYFFVLEGAISIGDHKLGKRDAGGFWDVEQLNISFDESTTLLAIEVPLTF
tara:strand:- start:50 stop:763 length:714 start_codon:yes stop_codon:yes gene_type:complete